MPKNEELIIVATHREDIDGIVSGALILRKFPNAKIFLLTPSEILKSKLHFSFVIDLPKPPFCEVNIDHHESNYRRLRSTNQINPKDLIDPTAPSAAQLVAKYFNLSDRISLELVEMANKADTGNFDDDLLVLDFFIKDNINDAAKLLWLIKQLSLYGRNTIKRDDLKDVFEPYRRLLNNYYTLLEYINHINDILNSPIVIFNSTKLPYSLVKVPPSIFVKNGGQLGVSFYIDPISGKLRFSIRANRESTVYANEIANIFGGGGHRLAAGFVAERDDELGDILIRLSHYTSYNFIPIVNLDTSKLKNRAVFDKNL